jgi:hypothetical protein
VPDGFRKEHFRIEPLNEHWTLAHSREIVPAQLQVFIVWRRTGISISLRSNDPHERVDASAISKSESLQRIACLWIRHGDHHAKATACTEDVPEGDDMFDVEGEIGSLGGMLRRSSQSADHARGLSGGDDPAFI